MDNVTISNNYNEVIELIKDKKIDQAQAALDAMSERDADWHFYQASVYHERGWAFESKSQLEMAINMDPTNEKYRKVLDKLLHQQSNASANPGNQSGNRSSSNSGRSYQSYENYAAGSARNNTALNCCQSLLCADCCCECMGGDLIRCC